MCHRCANLLVLRNYTQRTCFVRASPYSILLLSNVILLKVSNVYLVYIAISGVGVEYKHGVQLVSSIDGKVLIS